MPARGSAIVTPVSVRLPALVTVKVQLTVSPARPVAPEARPPSLTMVRREVSVTCTVAVASGAVTAPPLAPRAPAPAVLTTLPASTSVWVSAYVAVAVTLCPGASVPLVPDGHVP